MGIHIPSTLLQVSEAITVKVRVDRLSDRQLKNVARQVKAGYIPTYSNSATAHLARHLVKQFSVPCIKWSAWRIETDNIPTDHPIYDAVVNAAAISKLEGGDKPPWYVGDLDSAINQASAKGRLLVAMYIFSETGKKMITEAGRKGAVTTNNPVHAYLDKLVNREIEYVEMDTTS